MSSIFETTKVRIKTKSPIHIGSELGKISGFEFLVDKNFVYPVSEDRLSKFLLEKNLIQDYVNYVNEFKEKVNNKFNLQLFLRDKRINLSENDYLKLSNKRKIKVCGNPDTISEFRPFIRDGFSNIYIPGTSLKGSIRTAILYNVLKKLKKSRKSEFEEIENKIKDAISSNKERKKTKKIFYWVEKRFLQNFTLSSKQQEPNTDWLRMLHISDAYPIGNVQTILIPANVLKKEKNQFKFKQEKNQKYTTIWVECIPEGTIFEFEIMWDTTLMKEFSKNQVNLPRNIDDVISAIRSFSSDIIDYETKFLEGENNLRKWYSQTKPNFRFGFGSGMISTTGIMLVNEELRKKIRNFAGQERDDEAPKSRRIWNNNNKYIPLGWALLEKEPFDETREVLENSENQTNTYSQVKQNEPPKPTIERKIITVDAKLTWNPGNKTLLAEADSIRAFKKLDDPKVFIPEEFHKKLLEKRDKVKAKVEIKIEGNCYEIVTILK